MEPLPVPSVVYQYWFHCGFGSSFLSQFGSGSSDGSESGIFNDQKIKTFSALKSWNILSKKDVQVAVEVFSPKKRTSSSSKHAISSLFSIFVGHFCSPGFGSSRSKSMRIRIHNAACSPTQCSGSGSGHRIYMFLGLPDPDPIVRCMDPDPSTTMKK